MSTKKQSPNRFSNKDLNPIMAQPKKNTVAFIPVKLSARQQSNFTLKGPRGKEFDSESFNSFNSPSSPMRPLGEKKQKENPLQFIFQGDKEEMQSSKETVLNGSPTLHKVEITQKKLDTQVDQPLAQDLQDQTKFSLKNLRSQRNLNFGEAIITQPKEAVNMIMMSGGGILKQSIKEEGVGTWNITEEQSLVKEIESLQNLNELTIKDSLRDNSIQQQFINMSLSPGDQTVKASSNFETYLRDGTGVNLQPRLMEDKKQATQPSIDQMMMEDGLIKPKDSIPESPEIALKESSRGKPNLPQSPHRRQTNNAYAPLPFGADKSKITAVRGSQRDDIGSLGSSQTAEIFILKGYGIFDEASKRSDIETSKKGTQYDGMYRTSGKITNKSPKFSKTKTEESISGQRFLDKEQYEKLLNRMPMFKKQKIPLVKEINKDPLNQIELKQFSNLELSQSLAPLDYNQLLELQRAARKSRKLYGERSKSNLNKLKETGLSMKEFSEFMGSQKGSHLKSVASPTQYHHSLMRFDNLGQTAKGFEKNQVLTPSLKVAASSTNQPGAPLTISGTEFENSGPNSGEYTRGMAFDSAVQKIEERENEVGQGDDELLQSLSKPSRVPVLIDSSTTRNTAYDSKFIPALAGEASQDEFPKESTGFAFGLSISRQQASNSEQRLKSSLRAVKKLKEIRMDNFNRAQILDNNNDNAANLRHFEGDQKFRVKNRGMRRDVKALSYRLKSFNELKSHLKAQKSLNIKRLPAASSLDRFGMPLPQTTKDPVKTFIFNNEELEDREFDFQKCERLFKMKDTSSYVKQNMTGGSALQKQAIWPLLKTDGDQGLSTPGKAGSALDHFKSSKLALSSYQGEGSVFSPTAEASSRIILPLTARTKHKRECEKHGSTELLQEKYFQSQLGVSEAHLRKLTDTDNEKYRGVAPNRRQDRKLDYRDTIQQMEDIINGTDELPANQRRAAVEAAKRSKLVTSTEAPSTSYHSSVVQGEVESPAQYSSLLQIKKLREIQAEKLKVYKLKKSQLMKNPLDVKAEEAFKKKIATINKDGEKYYQDYKVDEEKRAKALEEASAPPKQSSIPSSPLSSTRDKRASSPNIKRFENMKPLEVVDDGDSFETAAKKFEEYFSSERLYQEQVKYTDYVIGKDRIFGFAPGYVAPRTSIKQKLQESDFKKNEEFRTKQKENEERARGLSSDFYDRQRFKMRKQARRKAEEAKLAERIQEEEDIRTALSSMIDKSLASITVRDETRTENTPEIEQQFEMEQKFLNDKLRALGRLRELSDAEQRVHYNEINDILKLPQININSYKERQMNGQLESANRKDRGVKRFKYDVDTKPPDSLDFDDYDQLDEYKIFEVARANFSQEVQPADSIKALAMGLERDILYNLKKQGKHIETYVDTEQNKGIIVGKPKRIGTYREELIFDEPQRQRLHNIFSNIDKIKEHISKAITSQYMMKLAEKIYIEMKDKLNQEDTIFKGEGSIQMSEDTQEMVHIMQSNQASDKKSDKKSERKSRRGSTRKVNKQVKSNLPLQMIQSSNTKQSSLTLHSMNTLMSSEQKSKLAGQATGATAGGTKMEQRRDELLQVMMTQYDNLKDFKKGDGRVKMKRKVQYKQLEIYDKIQTELQTQHQDFLEKNDNHKKLVQETIELLDFTMKARAELEQESKDSQVQFIKDFLEHGPDSSTIDAKYLKGWTAVQAKLKDLIGDRLMGEVRINKVRDSREFAKVFQKYERVQEMKEASNETLNLQILNSKPATSQFLNSILESEGAKFMSPTDMVEEFKLRVEQDYFRELAERQQLVIIEEEQGIETEEAEEGSVDSLTEMSLRKKMSLKYDNLPVKITTPSLRNSQLASSILAKTKQDTTTSNLRLDSKESNHSSFGYPLQKIAAAKRTSPNLPQVQNPLEAAISGRNVDLKIIIGSTESTIPDEEIGREHYRKFVDALEDIFPQDMNIGEKYTVIGSNIFLNEFMFDSFKKIYRKGFLRHLFRIFKNIQKCDTADEFEANHSNPMRFYKAIPQIEHKTQLADLDQLFQEDVNKNYYFNQAKGRSSNNMKKRKRVRQSIHHQGQARQDDSESQNSSDGEEQIIFTNQNKSHIQATQKYDQRLVKDYYRDQAQMNSVPLPNFAKVIKQVLLLANQKISEGEAKALKQFLIMSSHSQNSEFHIEKVVVSQSILTDKGLSYILEGIIQHRDFIRSVKCHACEFGMQSMNVMLDLIPYLDSLSLVATTGSFKEVHLKILQNCFDFGKKLQKLQLSQIALNDNEIVRSLCLLIQGKSFISHLDLSWTSLNAIQLLKISKALMKCKTQKIRDLNLSYNTSLYFNTDKIAVTQTELSPSEVVLASLKFVKNMCTYLRKSEVINHLNISGMGFGSGEGLEQLLMILKIISMSSQSLASIHLSDNGLRSSKESMTELADMYKLNKEESEEKVPPPTHFGSYLEKFIQENYNPSFQGLRSSQNVSVASKSSVDGKIKLADSINYMNQLIHGKVEKQLQKEKLAELGQASIAKVETSKNYLDVNEVIRDKICLVRKVNYPELAFKNDAQGFEVDIEQKWHFTEDMDCYICSKCKYTMIFFNDLTEREIVSIEEQASLQGEGSKQMERNETLTEIKDEQFLQECSRQFDSIKIDCQFPVILGSVTAGNHLKRFNKFSQGRHLATKMMRADIFTMMSVSQNPNFIKDPEQSLDIKRGCVRLLNHFERSLNPTELAPCLNQISFKLKGWSRILFDKCNYNYTTDVMVVNQPKNLAIKSQNSPLRPRKREVQSPIQPVCHEYVFSAFLPAGHHQLMIYSPRTKRAFFKQVFIEINQVDMCPSKSFSQKKTKKYAQNVWLPLPEDTDDVRRVAFHNDIANPNFELDIFIKDKEDVKDCLEILSRSFHYVQDFFIEALAMSNTYPEVDWQSFLSLFDDLQKDSSHLLPSQLSQNQMEIIFIRTTRNDAVKGLSGSLCRSQLLETLVRCCHQMFQQKRQKVSRNLRLFMDTIFQKNYDDSQARTQRITIRRSKILNQLLYDNEKCLRYIYSEHKSTEGGRTFDFPAAEKLIRSAFESFQGGKSHYQVSPEEMKKAFVYSKMTIKDEVKANKNYHSLQYVEFLEFICRIAMFTFSNLNRIARLSQQRTSVLLNPNLQAKGIAGLAAAAATKKTSRKQPVYQRVFHILEALVAFQQQIEKERRNLKLRGLNVSPRPSAADKKKKKNKKEPKKKLETKKLPKVKGKILEAEDSDENPFTMEIERIKDIYKEHSVVHLVKSKTMSRPASSVSKASQPPPSSQLQQPQKEVDPYVFSESSSSADDELNPGAPGESDNMKLIPVDEDLLAEEDEDASSESSIDSETKENYIAQLATSQKRMSSMITQNLANELKRQLTAKKSNLNLRQ